MLPTLQKPKLGQNILGLLKIHKRYLKVFLNWGNIVYACFHTGNHVRIIVILVYEK
jgi:hypothetical protein